MMLSEPLSSKEIQANFDSALKAAVETGQFPPSDQGFDEWTRDAIFAVAVQYPKSNSALIVKARNEIAGQLSGEHVARHEAALRAAIDALG